MLFENAAEIERVFKANVGSNLMNRQSCFSEQIFRLLNPDVKKVFDRWDTEFLREAVREMRYADTAHFCID